MHDSSFDDLRARVAAADPARGNSYRHANLTAALNAIVADRSTPIRVMRSFQLTMASAAAAAALVTTSAIAALSGAGNSLPILNFAAATVTTLSAPGLKVGAMAVNQMAQSNYTFTAGASLSSGVPTASVYTESAVVSDAHIRELATTTTVTYANGDTFIYNAYDGSVPTFAFTQGGSGAGDIAIATPMSSDSTPTTIPIPVTTPPVDVYGTPSDAQMSSLSPLDSLAALIGTDSLRFTKDNASASATSLSAWTQEYLDGIPVYGAQVNVELMNNVMTLVQGTDVSGLAPLSYPLLSAADGVAQVGSWSPGYSLGAGGFCEACMGGMVTTTSTAPTPVTLDAATLWLVPRTANSASGDAIATLLPAWEYSGHVDTWTGSFWSIAVDPAYLSAH